VRITAKTDYAIRACAELAAADQDTWINAESIATAQDIPLNYLLAILATLRTRGIVDSRRGVEGGYRLARPAYAIAVADVIRAVDGPLANVAGSRVEDVSYPGAAETLRDTWVALRASMREVAEKVTIEAIVTHKLPPHVRALIAPDESWVTRPEAER